MNALDLPAMRKAATGTLLVLVAVYLLTFLSGSPGTPLRLFRAAAGAGIVGALADWFAVVALFRHPMGIPIPHTALLPRNQERVAVNVGRFIEEHFLQPSLLVTQLRESKLAAKVSGWLLTGGHAELIVRPILSSATNFLRADLPADLTKTLASILQKLTRDASGSARTTQEVSELLKQGFRGETLTEIIGFLHDTVDRHRDTARALVSDNSRWWISARIEKNAADMIVKGLMSVLAEMSNPESALRKEFETAAQTTLDNAITQDRLQQVIARSVDAYLNSERFDDKATELIEGIKHHLADYLENETFIQTVLTTLEKGAKEVSEDETLQNRIDAGVAEIAGKLVPELRPYVGAYIAQTIRNWDPDMLVERFETEAGRDLQFIRINGALLGFLIGGGLFAIEHAIG
ncbi:DUF445 family protein [Shimia sp.]|uniref:DUF445 family protein n=1 Tax=Shimia sp. TaxID=1954381 RepID=UPI003BAA7B08